MSFVILLAGAFLLVLGWGWTQQREQLAALERDFLREKEAAWDEVIALRGRTLHDFTFDYSLWNEMVSFVEQPTADFINDNLDYLLRQNFDLHMVWVLDADFRLVYGATDDEDENAAEILDRWREPVRQRLEQESWPMRFFLADPEGPLEIMGYPIQPETEPRTEAPVRGWFFLARHWAHGEEDDLGRLINGEVCWWPAGEPRPEDLPEHEQTWTRWLTGPSGEPLYEVCVHVPLPGLDSYREHAERQGLATVGFVVLLIVALTVFALRSLARPLVGLAAAASGEKEEKLAVWSLRRDELGAVARAVARVVQQQGELRDEVERRAAAEVSLRFRERDLNAVLAERERLARNLHDGVIQSLYAVGLQLEALSRLAPPEWATRCEPIKHGLNRVIGDLRQFILGLEAGSLVGVGLNEALEDLVEQSQGRTEAVVELSAEDLPAGVLTPAEVEHLYFVTQELISNALRHGRPGRVQCRLEMRDNQLLLAVANDGTPFTAPIRGQEGGGWGNLRSRVVEMEARLEVVAAPPGWTEVRIWLDRPEGGRPSNPYDCCRRDD